MISRTARRYAKQVLRHMKKIAKASHGRLGVYTLSELMNEGKAKTAFARAVIERAMISGITPAQAAKELLEQRGEVRMMAGQNNAIFVKAKNLPKDELAVAHKVLFKKRAEGDNSFSQYTYSANYIHFFEGGSHIGAIEINGNEDLINDILNDRSNGRFDNVLKSIERYERRHSGNSTNSQEQRKTNRRTERIFSGEDKSQSTPDESRNTVQSNTNGEEIDLSNVQLMEGSDGTVYGWCEIERDAEGNVVARHIYLNDEVLNANTMVHELGQMKDIIY